MNWHPRNSNRKIDEIRRALLLLVTFCCCSLFSIASIGDSIAKPLSAHIDSTMHLFYYQVDSVVVDLVVGERPDTLDPTILFCAEAAFTGKFEDYYYDKNVAGNFVSQGQFHYGYKCSANSGGFIFYKDHSWRFLDKQSYNACLRDTAIQCAYEQALLVLNGEIYRPYLMRPERKETYRALCETRFGDLMVVTSKADIPYEKFVQMLVDELLVEHAVYMDMGSGWNYSWYRNENQGFTTFFPWASRTKFQTNWLIFKR